MSDHDAPQPEAEGGPDIPEEVAAALAAGAGGGIPVSTQITRKPKATSAEKLPDGTLEVSFIVLAEGEPQLHTYQCGEPGKRAILDAITGGLELPGR